jgi:hypothetical protein
MTDGSSGQAVLPPGSGGGSSSVPVVTRIEHATPRQHVLVWLIGVLFASLTPLLLPYFHGIDLNNTPSMQDLIGRGDLLLISLVLTIAGIAELIPSIRNISAGQLTPVAAILLGGLLAIVAEAFWYADISAEFLSVQKTPTEHVSSVITSGSLILFGASALCSVACVFYAAQADSRARRTDSRTQQRAQAKPRWWTRMKASEKIRSKLPWVRRVETPEKPDPSPESGTG